MKYKFEKNPIVISLGGSIIYPNKLNTAFLQKFNLLLRKEVKKGHQFVIVTGGGQICREYQQAAAKIGKITNFANDWLGIEATKLNAKLLQTIFSNIASPTIIQKRGALKNLTRPVTIASGWQPGSSSDHSAVALAIDFKAGVVLNASNLSRVYTADPKTHKNAKPISNLSWQDYLKLIPKKWIPGLNTPFDPVASELAMKHKKTVLIFNGTKIDNFKKLFAGENITGTVIS